MPADDPTHPHQVQAPHAARLICPYCGGITHLGTRCEHCRGLLDPLSRQATQNTMGPWFIRDEANPFRPGCSYETMKSLAARARIGPDTIVRGPTTRQFWCAARRAPGIAHLVGFCPDCGADVQPTDAQCDECHTPFEADSDRQFLGLGAVNPVPGQSVTEPAPAHPHAHQLQPPANVERAALDVARRNLTSARTAMRWTTASAFILLACVLALGYIAFLAATRSNLVAPPQATAPVEASNVKASPEPQTPAAPATEAPPPSQPAPPPDPKVDPNLGRAKRLLSEGTKESLTQLISLAQSGDSSANAEWVALKQAAERRLTQLNLRDLR